MCVPIIGGVVYISINTLTATINDDFEERATLVAQFFSAGTNSLEEISYEHFQGEIEKLDELNPDINKISVYARRGGRIIRIASTNHSQIGEAADPEDYAPLETNQATHAESIRDGHGL